MIYLVSSISNVLESIGVGVTGSIVLLALLIISFFVLLMFINNIPGSFIIIVFSILIISMNVIWGGTVLNILAIIVAMVLGVSAGLFMIKLFSSDGV